MKHEDLSSNPQLHIKNMGIASCTSNPTSVGRRDKRIAAGASLAPGAVRDPILGE